MRNRLIGMGWSWSILDSFAEQGRGEVLRNQIGAKLKACRALILVGEVSPGCCRQSIPRGAAPFFLTSSGLRKNQHMLQKVGQVMEKITVS